MKDNNIFCSLECKKRKINPSLDSSAISNSSSGDGPASPFQGEWGSFKSIRSNRSYSRSVLLPTGTLSVSTGIHCLRERDTREPVSSQSVVRTAPDVPSEMLCSCDDMSSPTKKRRKPIPRRSPFE